MQSSVSAIPVSITGLVIPHEWDGSGNITAVAILSPGEEEYVVLNEGRGIELLACLRKPVRAGGLVRVVAPGKFLFFVKSFEIIAAQSI